jgi:PKD repeat protein
VVYNYAAPSTYTVTLTVTNSAGTSIETNINYITALDPYVWWASNYFGCATCPQAAPDADPLGKGMSNTNQFLAGLNPTNSLSTLRIISVVQQSNDVNVTWTTAGPRPGRTPISVPMKAPIKQ